MKKPVVFVLICLVWGWTPSSGTTVISPAAELGKCSTWLSLLQGAGLAPEPPLQQGLLSAGGGLRSKQRMWRGLGLCIPSLPPCSLSHPFWLVERALLLSLGVGVKKGESPGMERAGEEGVAQSPSVMETHWMKKLGSGAG